jgi:hypothetical protein
MFVAGRANFSHALPIQRTNLEDIHSTPPPLADLPDDGCRRPYLLLT